MFKKDLQDVDESVDLNLEQKGSVKMTEAMPGPVPRQLSKKTVLATITEKQVAKSPATTSDNPAIPTGANSTSFDVSLKENLTARASIPSGSIGGASSIILQTKLRSESDSDNQAQESSEESDDEEHGAKTPRATASKNLVDDSSSGEEHGTKTPRATLGLSRPQAPKHRSSHRDTKVESPPPLDDYPASLSDEDDFDVEKNLAAATDTDLNATERDVESQDKDLHIRLVQLPGRQGRRHLTIFEGLGNEYDHKKLLKELKKAFACNGNVKKAEDDQNVKEGKSGQNRVIILQGNHCQDLKEFLMNEQVPAAKIRMHNF